MGQQQKAIVQASGQSYPEVKPIQIEQLQKYLNMGHFVKIQNSPQLAKQYQFLLKSQQSNHLIYGLKFTSKQFQQKQMIDLKDLNGPVQIYLLDNQKKPSRSTLCFQGQLFKGKRHNFGIQYNQSNIFYQGFFKNNKYQGWGVTTNYQGEWSNGTKCGYGKYRSNYPKGDKKKNFIYEGNWKNDQFDGLGARNISLSQSQLFIKQNYESKSSDIDYQYIGQWLDGMRFGCGKLIKYNQNGLPVKQIYQGEFARNMYHGRGKIKISQGNFQQGKFQLGKLVQSK